MSLEISKVWAAVPLSVKNARSPSHTMWHGPRPIFVPSGSLIHPAVWPQYITVTDRQITVGWIKMKLGMQVGLGHGHIVLDGVPASSPSPKEAQPREGSWVPI